MTDIASLVASALNLPVKGVTATIDLLDSGATVPFISRYRKERTGSLDEVEVRAIEQQLRRTREMEERREFVRQSIADAGGMTERLSQRLAEATTITEIEDIYAPFKPKKRTRATIAREKGLEPLAKRIMSGQMPRATDDEISGAQDIIAEWASESTRLRNLTRRTMQRTAILTASPTKGKEAELAASPLAGYGTFSQSVRRIASHQYLALRRAERELDCRVVSSALHPRVLHNALRTADVVIYTGVSPTPVIDHDTVAMMKRGVIIFDLTDDCGKAFPSVPTIDLALASPLDISLTEPSRACYINAGSAVARTAAMALSNTFATMLRSIVDTEGLNSALQLLPGLQCAALTFLGKPVNAEIAAAVGRRCVDIGIYLTLS